MGLILSKPIFTYLKLNFMNEEIKQQLDESGYDYAVAIATRSEVENGAACGQLSIIVEEVDE